MLIFHFNNKKKFMRNKFSFAVLSLALCLGACSKYDDTEIRKRADRLEQQISVVENNINSLRTLLEAQKSNAYITSIIAFTEGNGGYDITLSNGKSIKVYNGANGKNGENGRDGIDGKNGKDGKNGENGRDGIDGKNGKDGKNGENGRDGRDGVDGKNGKDAVASANPISSVDTSNSEYVVFNLRDGGSIRIPRNASMSFSFDNAEDFAVFAGKKYEIPYTCSALSGKSALKVIAQDGYKAKLSRKSDTQGIIELIVPSLAVDTEIIVLLSDGEGATKIYSMSIFAGTLSISSENYLAEKDGATITVPVTTNTNYSIEIAKDAQSWISHTATNLRALNTRNENIEFRVEPNPNTYLRSATIKLKNGDIVLKTFTIAQKGESHSYEATPGDLETRLNGNLPYRLKLSGKLIQKDFQFLNRNSDKIKILDLSDLDMTKLPSLAFSNSSFEEVILPNKLTNIPGHCFYSSKIKKINIPNSVTSIGESAFFICYNLSGELRIPNSVTSIGNSAFYNCTNLSGELRIPNSVISIDRGAFKNCKGFSSLIIEGTPHIGNSAFLSSSNEPLPMTNKLYSKSNNPKDINSSVFWAGEQYSAKPKTLYVPKGAKVAYEKLSGWNVFQKIIEIEESQFP